MSDFDAPEILEGLVFQPWQPLKVDETEEQDDEFSELLDMACAESNNDNDKRFQIKCQFMDQCLAVLLTDLINVWYCEQSQSEILSLQRTLNPAMQNINIQQINKQIQNMLCFSDQEGSDHYKKIIYHDEAKASFTMETKMKIINIVDFKWSFEFTHYGSHHDQSTLLKQQLILPLMSIANELASKLNPQSLSNQKNTNNNNNTVFQRKITDTFLEFNIRGTLGNLYKSTMDFLTLSQVDGGAAAPVEQVDTHNNMVSNFKISSINAHAQREIGGQALPALPKGRKRKRALVESMDVKDVGAHALPNKKRKGNRFDGNDSDDDVLRGLLGREKDLKISTFNRRKNSDDVTMDVDTMDVLNTNTNTEQQQEEIQRREELRHKLQEKKKKKKKKKKKLRI